MRTLSLACRGWPSCCILRVLPWCAHAQSMRFPSFSSWEASDPITGAALMTSLNPNHIPEAPPGLGFQHRNLGDTDIQSIAFHPSSAKSHPLMENTLTPSQQPTRCESHRPTVKWVYEDPPVHHPSSFHLPTHPLIHSSILPSSLHPSVNSPTHPGNKYLLRKCYVSGAMLPHLFKLCPISTLFLPLSLLTFLRSSYVSGTVICIALSNLLKILSWKGDHVSHFTDGKSTAQQGELA